MSLWFSECPRLLLNRATPIFPFNSYTYHIVIAVKICCIVMPAHCFALSFLAYFIFAYLPFSIIIVVNSILVLILVWYIFAKYNFYCFWLSFFSMFDAGILGITRLHIAKPQLFFNLTITATVAKLAIKINWKPGIYSNRSQITCEECRDEHSLNSVPRNLRAERSVPREWPANARPEVYLYFFMQNIG